ncbi:hypothetical protein HELRODRAFT_172941 [Helobdella robusta]|uniref:Fucolectin tachylectin-4 pentraxin-1 domain-containing protein n=1 Tax=Helobdella robusta TaxID=6412 RepID=T1F664_HELRO|nr:hypothetical protein HELRODRAFT_172941 [Helobdella robusta]ESO03913.1 hypothetical protein HELRODRAFT_172941 [Helobdella robusta]
MTAKHFKSPTMITLITILFEVIDWGHFTSTSSASNPNYYFYYDSYYAVDGKKFMNDSLAFCSLTVPGFDPHWIGVDLKNLFTIFYTILYAGTNHAGFPKRNDLDYFIVGVSNRSLDVHPPVRGTLDLCAQYPDVVASKQVVRLNCSSTTPPARYVILLQPSNSTGYMSVCEFEVYGVPYGSMKYNINRCLDIKFLPLFIIFEEFKTNLLLKSPSTSSSYLTVGCGNLTAALVVDGFHDPYFSNCHCGITADTYGKPNWFKFDMKTGYNVDYIAFTSRRWEDPPTNMDFLARLSDNFTIGLTNVTSTPVRNNYPSCATWPGYVKVGSRVEMKCNANLPKYRYLIAQASPTASGKFMICELEAYEPTDASIYFIFQFSVV